MRVGLLGVRKSVPKLVETISTKPSLRGTMDGLHGPPSVARKALKGVRMRQLLWLEEAGHGEVTAGTRRG